MKRGRPPKFGRSAELVALTLPHDVLDWLRSINADPAWAIVSLFERNTKRRRSRRLPRREAELAQVGRRRALIVVDHKSFPALPGVAVVPLAGDRAFLALEPGKGVTDLELAVLDRLEESSVNASERKMLTELRHQLRAWRQDPSLRFYGRSIIVVERRNTPRSGTRRNGGP